MNISNKMKRLLLFILATVLLTLAGCRSKKQVLDKPDNLINRSTMVNIIAESYIIESTVHTSPDTVNRAALAKIHYRDLFNRYKITREQFESSLNYYISEENSAEALLAEASALIIKKRKELNIPEVTTSPVDAPESESAPTDNVNDNVSE